MVPIVHESHYRKKCFGNTRCAAVLALHHYVDITTAEAANYSLTGLFNFIHIIAIEKKSQ